MVLTVIVRIVLGAIPFRFIMWVLKSVIILLLCYFTTDSIVSQKNMVVKFFSAEVILISG